MSSTSVRVPVSYLQFRRINTRVSRLFWLAAAMFGMAFAGVAYVNSGQTLARFLVDSAGLAVFMLPLMVWAMFGPYQHFVRLRDNVMTTGASSFGFANTVVVGVSILLSLVCVALAILPAATALGLETSWLSDAEAALPSVLSLSGRGGAQVVAVYAYGIGIYMLAQMLLSLKGGTYAAKSGRLNREQDLLTRVHDDWTKLIVWDVICYWFVYRLIVDLIIVKFLYKTVLIWFIRDTLLAGIGRRLATQKVAKGEGGGIEILKAPQRSMPVDDMPMSQSERRVPFAYTGRDEEDQLDTGPVPAPDTLVGFLATLGSQDDGHRGETIEVPARSSY